MYVQLGHFVVKQKLTEFCKSTIIEKNKNLRKKAINPPIKEKYTTHRHTKIKA